MTYFCTAKATGFRARPMREKTLLMIYRFKIVSEEVPGLRIEIQISSDANFLQLRNAILDAAGYNRLHADMFFLCDEDWTPREQVAMTDEGSDSDTDVWIMADTAVEDLVDEEGQKMLFVFDTDKGRYLHMEMREMIFDRSLSAPVCTLRQGRPPHQRVKDPEPVKETRKPRNPPVLDELGLDFYGSDQYEADELPEGLEGEE